MLPLPGNVIPTEVTLDGDMLYARSAQAVFCRRIRLCAKSDPLAQTEPKFVGYYD